MVLITSLVGLVQLLVVSSTVFPYSMKDFEPAFSQAPKGDVVRSTLGTFPLIKLCGPAAVAESAIKRKVDQCLVESMITGTSLSNPPGLVRSYGHRCCAAQSGKFID